MNNNIKLKFKLLTPTAKMPKYAHAGDSGMDICADEDCYINNAVETISTGVAAVIPDGYELQVRPLSGMAEYGLFAAFGTVDCGYRGEIKVTLIIAIPWTHNIKRGDRIAQLVLAPVVRAEIEETDDLGEATERGANGFGSTGR